MHGQKASDLRKPPAFGSKIETWSGDGANCVGDERTTHPEEKSSSESGSITPLLMFDSSALAFLRVGCLAGSLWAVEVRAGVCRALWMLLLSNQDPLTVLDAEPRGD